MGFWDNAPVIKAPPSPRNYSDEQYLSALYEYLKRLADNVAIMAKGVEETINGRIDAKNIRADSIETRNLKAGAVTADKISVNELSAISADLGHIRAGLVEAVEIFGSYIATDTGYPRIEFSSDDNLLKAMTDANQYISISPDDLSGVPILIFNRSSQNLGALVYIENGAINILGSGSTNVNIRSTSGDVRISGNNIDLDGNVYVSSGDSGTFDTADGKTVTVEDGIITDIF